MKFFKNIVICLSVISLITIYLVSFPVKVYAEVPSNQIVQKHDGAWGSYAFDYSLQGKYFTIQDSTGIPTSTYLNAQYFYTDDNITFYALEGKDLYTAILNRGIGIAVKGDYLTTLYESFMSSVGSVVDTTHLAYLQGALYDSNNVFLGYCVNDISGCYYNQPTPSNTPAVDVPSELTNDVYNHYQYYNQGQVPDFITFICPSNEYLLSKQYTISNLGADSTYNNEIQSNFYNMTNGKLTGNARFFSSSDTNFISFFSVDYDHLLYYEDSNNYTYSNWNNFCNYFDLDTTNNELLFSDFMSKTLNQYYVQYINFMAYDNNNNVVHNYDVYNYNEYSHTFNYTAQTNITLNYTIGNKKFDDGYTRGYPYTCTFGKNITIYKNLSAYQGIKNQTYEQNTYISDSYKNYNVNEDNSININYSIIDNSQNYNDVIYNNLNDSFYENVDNSYVDTSQITNNTTTIINNYYGNGSGGGNGGGDDNPSDDDINNDSVLSALLEAIRHFFHVIGQLLGTILTGLLDVINSILEATTGIIENMTGVIDFISALFGWIPSPVPEVLAVGISITILFAIIRFIRG